jgi:hypothetical protein
MRWVLLASVVAAAACGAASRSAEKAELDQLRFLVVSEPKDVDARRDLAAELERRGFPGVALGHLDYLRRVDKLDADTRTMAAELFLRRGRERLAWGDEGAHLDFGIAASLDPKFAPGKKERRRARAAQALAQLRRSGNAADEAELLALDEGLRRSLVPGSASVDELGEAGQILWRAGAKRRGFEVLDRYVKRGGRHRNAVVAWREARLWWSGAEPLTAAQAELLSSHALDTCAFSSGDMRGTCLGALYVAANTAGPSQELVRSARRNNLRTDDPVAAAAWVTVLLHQWLSDGRVDWMRELGDRIRFDTLDLGKVPLFARATLARAMGRQSDAAAALADAMRFAAELTVEQRTVVQVEWMLQSKDGLPLDTLTPGARLAATLAAMTGSDREYGDLVTGLSEDGVLALRAHSPLARVAKDRRALANLRRLLSPAEWRLLGQLLERFGYEAPKVEAGRFAPIADAFGNPWSSRELTALDGIVAAYDREPAVSDRLAIEFVGGQASAIRRGLGVARLFAALGDPARFHRWAEAAWQESPGNSELLFVLAQSTAAIGDLPRARIHFDQAAAFSGDPGAVYLAAARALLFLHREVAALQMARQAYLLSSSYHRQDAGKVVVSALNQLERHDEAEKFSVEAGLARQVNRMAGVQSLAPRARLELAALAVMGDVDASAALVQYASDNANKKLAARWRQWSRQVEAAGFSGSALAHPRQRPER